MIQARIYDPMAFDTTDFAAGMREAIAASVADVGLRLSPLSGNVAPAATAAPILAEWLEPSRSELSRTLQEFNGAMADARQASVWPVVLVIMPRGVPVGMPDEPQE